MAATPLQEDFSQRAMKRVKNAPIQRQKLEDNINRIEDEVLLPLIIKRPSSIDARIAVCGQLVSLYKEFRVMKCPSE